MLPLKLCRMMLIFFFVIVGTHLQAQYNYKDRWDEIDTLLIEKDLPKSALEKVNVLYSRAHKDALVDQSIKALLYKYALEKSLSDRTAKEDLKVIQDASLHPINQMEEALIWFVRANIYSNYYSSHRWKIIERKVVSNNKSEDLEIWTDADFKIAIYNAYKKGFSFENILKKATLKQYDAIVMHGNADYLRPTIYDLLMQNAVEHYSESDYNYYFRRTEPKHPFVLNQKGLMDVASTFVHVDLGATEDGVSHKYVLMQLYQQWLAFHLHDQDPDVCINIDNQRLKWLQTNTAYNTARDSMYLAMLRQTLEVHPQASEGQQSALMIANYYERNANSYHADSEDSVYRWSRVKALAVINKYWLKDSVRGEGWSRLKLMKSQIEQSCIEATKIESQNIPNEPILCYVKYKNIDRMYVRVVKIGVMDADAKWHDKNITTPLVDSFSIQIKNDKDYRTHSTEIKINPLPSGQYVVLIGTTPDMNDSRSETNFSVSALVMVQRENDVFVLDRTDGAPVNKVSYQIFRSKRNVKKTEEKVIQRVRGGNTDQDGYIDIATYLLDKQNRDMDAYLLLTKGKDSLYETLGFPYTYYHKETQNKEESVGLVYERKNAGMFFYTDRAIYRPGQRMSFKGVFLTNDSITNGSKLYRVTDKLKVYLRDPNSKNVDSLILEQNEFGAIVGSFNLPTGRLSGRYSLVLASDYSGYEEFRVEEYKRPTFYIQLDTLKSAYRFGDTITQNGWARSYAGTNVNNAKVKARISRFITFPYQSGRNSSSIYKYDSEEVLDTLLKTDENGMFTIPFVALPDADVDSSLSPLFNYGINVDITDNNGETRSQHATVNVGYQPLIVDLNVFNGRRIDSLQKLQVMVRNSNNVQVPSYVDVKISELQAPDPKKIYRKRQWNGSPDNPIMDSVEFATLFPSYMYRENSSEYNDGDDESNYSQWKIKKVVYERHMQSDSNMTGLESAPSGYYRVEASVTLSNGQKISNVQYVIVDNGTEPQNLEPTVLYINTDNTSVDINIPPTVRFATGCKDLNILQLSDTSEFAQESIVNHHFWSLKRGVESKLLAPIKSRGGKHEYQFFAFYNNRSYDRTLNLFGINKPKYLTLEYTTFRNKVEPGAKEKWTIRIKDTSRNYTSHAELLSGMYDASLDAIQKNVWRNSVILNHNVKNFYSIDSWRMTDANTGYIYQKMDKYLFNRQTQNVQYPNCFLYLVYLKGRKSSSNFRPATSVGSTLIISKKYTAGASAVVHGKVLEDRPVTNVMELLQGKVAGLDINISSGSPGAMGVTNLRGISSNQIGAGDSRLTATSPLFVVDDIINKSLTSPLSTLPPASIESVEFIEQQQAVSLYGDAAMYGAVVIITKVYKSKMQQPKLRSNFNETAFFLPEIHADSAGNYNIEFEMPDAVTQWKWQNLAYTKDLQMSYSEQMITSQKMMMVQPNLPRFLRAGDQITLSAKVSNLSDSALDGNVFIQLLDGEGKILNWLPVNYNKPFSVAKKLTTSVALPVTIPNDYSGPIQIKIWANAGKCSDGEQQEIPVLSRQISVTDALPFELKGDTTLHLAFDKLKNKQSNTLRTTSLTVEYSSNPVWYAIQALPYLISYPYECSEQLFNKYYANALANYTIHKYPKVKEVFQLWEKDSAALRSNLQKNQTVKQVLLEETPWLANAESEDAQKLQLAKYFQQDTIANNLNATIEKLSSRQLEDGSFPWFSGMTGSRYITQYIVNGIGRLYHLNALPPESKDKALQIATKARHWLAQQVNDSYQDLLKIKKVNLAENHISSADVQFLYGESFFTHKNNSAAYKYYLNQSQKYWINFSDRDKASIAMLQYRNNNKAFAINKVVKSLIENAVESPIDGTYWKYQGFNHGSSASIENHSLIMSVINEIADSAHLASVKKSVEEMQHYLIRKKQTNNWNTTVATSEAIYALLSANSKWLSDNNNWRIQLGDTTFLPKKIEAGTGYFKAIIPADRINAQTGNITITQSSPNKAKRYSYGSIYWQYLEDIDKIEQTTSPLSIKKQLYKEISTDAGLQLELIKADDTLSVGDKIVVQLTIQATRDMEYVHVKDLRASLLEPDNVLSGYHWQNGLGYYESTKDVSSNYFIGKVPKGIYTFEYSTHVTHLGSAISGIATIECMYAPEFDGRSDASILQVK